MIRPAKFDYSHMIVPSSDEDSDEEGPISPPRKRRSVEESDDSDSECLRR